MSKAKIGAMYGKPFVSIHFRRPPLVRLRKGHVPPKPNKPRRSTFDFNNAWQSGRYLKVANQGFVEACEERGIKVRNPQELFTAHLPVEFKEKENSDLGDPLALGPFGREEDHPFHHSVPAYTFDALTYMPKGRQLDHAKVLCKAVEVQTGLPKRLAEQCKILRGDNGIPDQDDLVMQVIKETQMLDATQSKLPKNVAVPYIGWHPVEDRMHRKMPYDVTKMSWNRGVPRDYGIPIARKNLNLTRGMLRCCDMLAGARPSLLNRHHMENAMVRQFVRHGKDLVRFYLPLQHLVSDPEPLPPYADQREVSGTDDIPLPDIYPLSPTSRLFPTNVYNPEQNFPIRRLAPHLPALQNSHTGIEHYNSFVKVWRKDEGYYSQSCVLGFLTALGQARLTFGDDVGGVLPSPVTVNFVSTDGRKFHFSAFQLNTLDLAEKEGVKNIFWHDPQVHELYQVCHYESAVPKLEGYDPNVFPMFAALYLENSH